MYGGVSVCSVSSFKDAYNGTGLRMQKDVDGKILSIPLHNCLIVKDKYMAPHSHRAFLEVNHEDVRLQSTAT